ncbi:MAG TPA: MFS transporter, partial [Pseudonocardiaceae bacterium]|nr:MFS transporter [Pseudonocardiaceae bacterium]
VLGWVTAAGLLAQLPSAAAATLLFSLGGYELVGWVSVGTCLAAATLASRMPEPPRAPDGETGGPGADPADAGGYLTTLSAGLAEVAARPVVRSAVLAVAVLTSLDGLEEYFPLLAQDWGVPTTAVPLAMLAIPLAGAAGAALGGPVSRLPPSGLAVVLGVAVLTLGVAGLVPHPAGLAAVAVFYGLYRMVLVAADSRLQERIDGSTRATVTSVAAMGSELAAFALYAGWALGGLLLVVALMLVAAPALPRLLRSP